MFYFLNKNVLLYRSLCILLAHDMFTRLHIIEYKFNKMENSTISWSGRVGSQKLGRWTSLTMTRCVFACSCVRGVRLRTLDWWKAMRCWQWTATAAEMLAMNVLLASSNTPDIISTWISSGTSFITAVLSTSLGLCCYFCRRNEWSASKSSAHHSTETAGSVDCQHWIPITVWCWYFSTSRQQLTASTITSCCSGYKGPTVLTWKPSTRSFLNDRVHQIHAAVDDHFIVLIYLPKKHRYITYAVFVVVPRISVLDLFRRRRTDPFHGHVVRAPY